MIEPVYGLKVAPRLYRCRCCNHEHELSTNHTGPCWPECPNCSWRSAYDDEGNHYRADTQKQRPHVYAGPPPTDADRNPHAPRQLDGPHYPGGGKSP